MSFLNEQNKTTAIVLGSTAVGAIALYYLWDRYSADTATWSARKENAKETLHNAEKKMEQKYETVKENVKEAAHKVTGSTNSSTGKNIANAPAPVLTPQSVDQKTRTVEQKIIVTPLPVTETVAPVVNVVSTSNKTTFIEQQLHDPNPIINEPELKKVKERAPVVQEVVHPVEVEEIQPVIHREIKKVEVHQITQPIYEEYTAPLREITKDNIPEHRPTVYEDTTKYSRDFEDGIEVGSKTYGETKKTTVYKPAIVEEVIKTDIIEVIQPVIHRDTVEPVVVHTNQPIYEKVKEQPVVVHETRKPIILTHDQVERLQASQGEEQLAILEGFSVSQNLGVVADRTYDDTPVVAPVLVETQTTVTTTEVKVL